MSARGPGYEKALTVNVQEFLHSTEGLAIVPGGVTLDKDKSYDGGNTGRPWVIRAGHFLSRNSSSGKYMPVKRTRINGTSGSVTAFVVDNPNAFKVGDVITVGGDTTKTITAIDYTTKTITVSGSAFTVADNDVVFCETANEGLPELLLMETVSLRDADNVNAVEKVAAVASEADVTIGSLFSDMASILADATSKGNIVTRYKLWDGVNGRYSTPGVSD